ncbi:MAG: alginate export family protein [Deltaproteobacteria bacterium]|nr:alginate export family protein [Deltaproteobacteria bacterium]
MKGRIGTRVFHWATLGLAVVALSAATAQAEVSLLDKDGLKLGFTFTGAFGYVDTSHLNFGGGLPSNGEDNVDWAEGFLKPGLTASFDTGAAGTVYGGWAMLGTKTWGGPDAIDFNDENPSNVDQDQLFAGWRSGKLIPGGENVLDLSFGQQNFQLGDGFLVWDGNGSGPEEGAYWLGPKSTFHRAAVARINTSPVRGDLFFLVSDADSGTTKAWGVNVEYPIEKIGTLAGMFLKVKDAKQGYDFREGMRIYDLRFQGTPVENLFVSAEGALERGTDADLKAAAWYGEVGYTLATLPWAPTLSYRYSQFSGDDPSTDDSEAFDPLFYGFGRGWGTWFQGEIVGEYLMGNTNERAHQLVLKVKPAESLGVGVQLYRFFLDEAHYYGDDSVRGRHFADEINVYADWQATANLYLGAVAGIAKPGEAVKSLDYFGDRNYGLFELNATVTF